MSFYGNISNAGKTNLTFDKIYSTRRQMEGNATSDGVFVNRYVLIEYDDNTFSRKRGYINEVADFEKIRRYMANDYANEEEKELLNRFIVYHDSSLKIPYVLNHGNINTGYGIEKYELIEVKCETIWNNGEDNFLSLYFYCTGDSAVLDGQTYSICKILSTSMNPYDAETDYALNYLLDREWAAAKGRKYYQEFSSHQGWDSTIWQKVIESGVEKYRMIGSLNSKNPIFNIVEEAPSINPTAPHFGSNSNNMEYTLHMQPNWGLKIKPATIIEEKDEDGNVLSSTEYSDQVVTYNGKHYNPGTQTDDWYAEEYNGAIYYNKAGFNQTKRSKITEIENEISLLPTGYSVPKDENGNYIPRYISHSRIEGGGTNLVPTTANIATADISAIPADMGEVPAYNDLTYLEETSEDGNEDTTKDPEYETDPIVIEGQRYEARPDIQELTFHLPEIGNAISDMWDLVYGEYEYNDDGTIKFDETGLPVYKEDRNLDIDWNSTEGTRMVTVDNRFGGYNYQTEKVRTLAGCINSVHDLMGMIVVSDQIPTLASADTSHIYYGTLLNGKKGFYIKTPKCSYLPLDKEKFEEYTNGKLYVDLTQYVANKYHTLNNGNYYFATEEKPDTTTTYFIVEGQKIRLKSWTDIPESDNVLPDVSNPITQTVHYYLDSQDNYILDTDKEAKPDRNYFTIKPTQATFPSTEASTKTVTEIFNPEPRIKHINEETGEEYYSGYLYFKYTIETDEETGQQYKKYDDKVYELVPQAYELKNGVPTLKTDSDGNPVWDYNKTPSTPYPEDDPLRDYYYVEKFTTQIATDFITGEETLTIMYQQEGASIPTIMDANNKPSDDDLVIFLNFAANNYYALEEKVNFIKIHSADDLDKTKVYYTIEATPETGLLPSSEDTPEGEEKPEDIYTHYYVKNKYFYKYNENDYIYGTEEKMVPGVEYYIITKAEPQDVTFYEANKYYYSQEIENSEGEKEIIEVLDSNDIMKTSTDEGIQTNKDGLVYYLKQEAYIIKDSSGILAPGSVWNSNGEIPDSITLGKLYMGETTVEDYDESGNIVEMILNQEQRAERLFQWKELTGFSRTLNTINGLIVKINQFFKFGDTLTRDRSTIQGCLNCINDLINDFGTLIPGEIAVIDEYGRVKSATLFTTEEDKTDGWISVIVDPNVSDTQITIRHNNAKETETVLGQTNPKSLIFGDTFKAISFGIDDKGHVPASQFKEVTMTLPELIIDDTDNKQIITDLVVREDGQAFVATRENVGNFALTGYTIASTAADIAATDTVNQAFGKLQAKLNKEIEDRIEDVNAEEQDRINAINALDMAESASTTQFISKISQTDGKLSVTRADAGTLVLGTEYKVATADSSVVKTDSINSAVGKLEYKLNLLNSDANTPGSIAYKIAEMVIRADEGGIDKLEEIAAWIVSDTSGAAKMNSDIKTNANAIKELEKLVGDTAVATQISDAISTALTSEGTDKYALATELVNIADRVSDIENILTEDKINQWNAAEANVQSDWNETDTTSSAFIKNKPDLNNLIKTTTKFNYTYEGTTSQLTINELMTYIASLEKRIYNLENPTEQATE